MGRLCLTLALVWLCALPSAAPATFPGQSGKLAFNGIDTMNPDGTGLTRLTPGVGPAWSPDGAKIAFSTSRDGNSEIYVMNADGSGQQRLTVNPAHDTAPSWSPDGARLAFSSNRDGNSEIYVMNADGSGQARITNSPGGEFGPEWSPDGARIAFGGAGGVYTIRPDGSGRTFVLQGFSVNWSPDGDELWSWHQYYDETIEDDYYEIDSLNIETGEYNAWTCCGYAQDPVVSPDNTEFHYHDHTAGGNFIVSQETGAERRLTSGAFEGGDWQPLPVNTPSTHVRPAGATPFRASLVPAFNACSAGNRTHGPPLVFPSCAPPQPGSPNLTVGVGDGSPALSRSIGFVRIVVHPGTSGGVDDTDVAIRFSLSNVMKASDLSEYTGELRASAQVRLTDREGSVAQTTVGFPLEFDVPCVGTAPTNEKSLCELTTTLDAVTPGAAAEGTRAVWALDRVKVHDGGPDGDADTTADNSLFAVQGVFVP